MNDQERSFLEIPLGTEAHRLANKFAAEQSTNAKGKQVYLNTLAVYAVHRYLQYLQVETDLSDSDSWHPVLRRQWDVADLSLPQVGTLECRPILPGETALSLPPEVTENRIGYLAVRLDESLTQATLLGFVKKAGKEELPISRLNSLEDLLEHIDWHLLEPVYLTKWFDYIFEKGWKRCEAPVSQLAMRFWQRLRVAGAKQIDLGTQLSGSPLDLVLTLTEKSSQRTRIEVQVRSREGETLPEGLKLMVIEESGETFSEVSTGLNEEILKPKPFSGYSQEIFTIKLAIVKAFFTEKFVV